MGDKENDVMEFYKQTENEMKVEKNNLHDR